MIRTDFLTPLATRLAVLTLALTAVLGTPAVARPPAARNNVNRSAPVARRSAAPARGNTARPAQSARQNTARPNATRQNAPRQTAASRPNAARPNAARPNAARPSAARPNTARNNTAKPNAAGHNTGQTKSNSAHPNTAAKNGQAAHGGAGKGAAPAARNASNNGHGVRQISPARFNASFGRGHQFHIGHPIMIGGQASFQFGGFWFGIVDPWPAAWLYTDAVYVDFVEGGYVLVNVAHPEVQVAVSAGDAVTSCTVDPLVPAAPVVAAPVVATPVVATPVVATPVVAAPVVAAPIVVAVPYLTWHYWRHFRR